MKNKIDPLVAGFLGSVAVAALLLPFAASPLHLVLLLMALTVAMGCISEYVARRWRRH